MKLACLLSLFLLTDISLAQYYSHKAQLVSSAHEIRSDESFDIKYTLSGVNGYFYVSVRDDNFEFIGPDRWEGMIGVNESKVIRFRLRLRENRKPFLTETIPVVVGFSLKQFRSVKSFGEVKLITIKLKDYDHIRKVIDKQSQIGTAAGKNSESTEVTDTLTEAFFPEPTITLSDSNPSSISGEAFNDNVYLSAREKNEHEVFHVSASGVSTNETQKSPSAAGPAGEPPEHPLNDDAGNHHTRKILPHLRHKPLRGCAGN